MAFDNLVDVLEGSRGRFADRPLFGTKTDDGWQWIRYGDFAHRVDAFRAALKQLGVGAGDRVAIVSDNRVEWAVAAYATYGLRAAFVPMYTSQKPKEWRFILRDSGSKLVIGSGAEVTTALEEIAREEPSVEHVVGLDLPVEAPHSYLGLLERGAEAVEEPERPGPSEIAGLVYTSGTTGDPKGVMLSHENICSNVSAIHEIFPLDETECSLSFLPWAHSFGQTCELHMLLSMGCSMAINDDVAHLIDNLAEIRPTILFAVPRIFNRLYDVVQRQISERPRVLQRMFQWGVERHGEDLGALDRLRLRIVDRLIFSRIRARFGGRLKYAFSGSAALSPEVAEFIDALGIVVYEGYGLTETSPIVSANRPGERKLGSVGKAVPGVTVRLETAEAEDPEHGEIVVHGPNVMVGYHNRPHEDAQVFTEERGFRTGDLGRIDDDGYLYITGRIKEQYKLETGKYVAPGPLEEQLKLSPYIGNVFIYGDNRAFNVALIYLDPEAIASWAKSSGHEIEDPSKDARVIELIRAEIERLGAGFKGFERPRRFALLTEDFDSGLLTPTFKLKRARVAERYRSTLDSLYESAD